MIRSPMLPLNLAEFVKEETEYLPINALLARLKYYIDMLETTHVNGYFEYYLHQLIEPLYERFGWEEKENEPWLDK